jgi:kynurenine formamidase
LPLFLSGVLGRQGYASGDEIVKSQMTGALFVVAPLKLSSGTGSPVRALALVPLS